jgi:hypothetical protein
MERENPEHLDFDFLSAVEFVHYESLELCWRMIYRLFYLVEGLAGEVYRVYQGS